MRKTVLNKLLKILIAGLIFLPINCMKQAIVSHVYQNFNNKAKQHITKEEALAQFIKTDFKKLIVQDPAKVLMLNTTIAKLIETSSKKANIEQMSDTNLIIKFYKKIIQQIETIIPTFRIFMLGECTKQDFSACKLSRLCIPRYRRSYENKVCNALNQKMQEAKSMPVHYVSFACGGLFSDLIVLTKTLTKNPEANIVINLIDLEHSPHVVALDIQKNTRQVTENTNINLDAIMPQIIEIAKKDCKDASNKEIEQAFKIKYLCRDIQFKQLINFLKKSFPRSKLTFVIHNTADSYLRYIEKYGISYPDVITAADIDDEMSILCGGLSDYYNMCIKMLQKKYNAYNILLSKIKGPQLVSFSLENSKSSIKLEIDKKLNIQKPVYLLAEDI